MNISLRNLDILKQTRTLCRNNDIKAVSTKCTENSCKQTIVKCFVHAQKIRFLSCVKEFSEKKEISCSYRHSTCRWHYIFSRYMNLGEITD
jgi:hypothetical protein